MKRPPCLVMKEASVFSRLAKIVATLDMGRVMIRQKSRSKQNCGPRGELSNAIPSGNIVWVYGGHDDGYHEWTNAQDVARRS